MQGLAVGRIVHYVMTDSDSPRFAGKHRPAIIVETWGNEKSDDPQASVVNLVVFVDGINDGPSTCIMWQTSKKHSDGMEPGTWHWPELV